MSTPTSSTDHTNSSKKQKTVEPNILENEQEIMQYISSFDMKLSVVLLKIQLNSLMTKYKYKSEISPEFLQSSKST